MELDSADKLMCLEQSFSLSKSSASDILNFLWEPPVFAGCHGVSEHEKWKCTKSRFLSRKEAEGWRREGTFPLTLWMAGDWEQLDVCGNCMAAMKTAHHAALQTFWDGLPQRFGFPGWAELAQMKENALTV
jgi:hypothetical protein